MNSMISFSPGGYRFIDGVFQFSGGVAAEPGFAIERVTFVTPKPLDEAFATIETYLERQDRPTSSICAFELRSPKPFTEQDFVDFNRQYLKTLDRWGLIHQDRNPVARTNTCPAHNKPEVSSVFSFSYTVPSRVERPTFIVTGSAEAKEGEGDYKNSIVRVGDRSPEGLRQKMCFVRSEQERRLAMLGFSWKDALNVRAYCLYDIGPMIREELINYGIGGAGILWQMASPPVQDCDYEMDARSVLRELII